MGPNERRAQEENSSFYYGWNKDGSFSHGLTREEKESRLREARAQDRRDSFDAYLQSCADDYRKSREQLLEDIRYLEKWHYLAQHYGEYGGKTSMEYWEELEQKKAALARLEGRSR